MTKESYLTLHPRLFSHPDKGVALVRLTDGVLLRVNRRLEEICGTAAGALDLRPFASIFREPERDDPLHPEEILTTLAEYGLWQGEIQLNRPDGAVRFQRATLLGLDDAGSAPLALLLVTDISEQRQARLDMEFQARKYHTVVRTSIAGFFFVDTRGRILETNRTFAEMLGYTIEELTGLTLPDIEARETPEETAAHIEKIINTGRDTFESLHRRKDGGIVDVELSVNYNREFGEIFWAFVRDISEKKRAAARLQASQASLAEAQRIAQIGSFAWDLLKNRVDVSDEGLRQIGYRPGEITPTFELFRGFVHPEDRPRVDQCMDEAIRHGVPFSVEARMFRRDGGEWLVHLRGAVQRDESGRAVQLLGTQQDITELKATEEGLRLQSEITTHMAEGVLLAREGDGLIIYTNTKLEQMFGYGATELLERRLSILGGGPSGALTPGIVEELEHTGSWQGELQSLRKDGAPFWCQVSVTRFDHYEHGRLLVVVYSDITEQKRAIEEQHRLESKLHQAQKMQAIGTLAGGVAHEFNNLLGVILGNADMLEEALPPESTAARQNARVLRAGRQARDLVGKILTFSRTTEHRRSPQPLQQLVANTLAFIQSSIPTSVTVRQEMQADHIHVHVNPDEIQQVLLNLISNALYAMEECGELGIGLTPITVDAEEIARVANLRPGDYLLLTVTDSGQGMDGVTRKRIFEPFFTTKEVGKGVGMGLALVYGIMEGCGGAIHVDSRPGRGTTFSLYFPVVEPAVATPDAAAPRLAGGQGLILLVDDHVDVLETGRELLEGLGYAVIAATDPLQALALFRKAPGSFDLVITDQVMPQLSGAELTGRVLELRNDIPIVICTGFSERMDEARARELGARGFLLKPITRSEIAPLLRDLLHQKQEGLKTR